MWLLMIIIVIMIWNFYKANDLHNWLHVTKIDKVCQQSQSKRGAPPKNLQHGPSVQLPKAQDSFPHFLFRWPCEQISPAARWMWPTSSSETGKKQPFQFSLMLNTTTKRQNIVPGDDLPINLDKKSQPFRGLGALTWLRTSSEAFQL